MESREMDRPCPTAYGLRLAMDILRRRSRFTYYLSFLFARPCRDLFALWYAYFRWVDDQVDDQGTTVEWRQRFLVRQEYLLKTLYEGGDVALGEQENLLALLVDYDRHNSNKLRLDLFRMLAAIKFDFQRIGNWVSKQQLYGNYRRETESYLNVIAHFAGLASKDGRAPGWSAALGAKLTHVLRDFARDCREGVFNASRDELELYGLTAEMLLDGRNDAVRRWVAAKARSAERLLHEGLADIGAVRNVRYQVIICALITKYQYYLRAIRDSRFLVEEADLELRPILITVGIVRNLGRVWYRRILGRSQACGHSSSRDQLIDLSVWQSAGLLWSLSPYCNRPLRRSLNATLKALRLSTEQYGTTLRRFIVAYHLGVASWQYVNDDVVHSGAYAKLAEVAGLLFGYWALLGIEFDSLVDAQQLDSASAEGLGAAILKMISPQAGLSNVTHWKDFEIATAGSPTFDKLGRFLRQMEAQLHSYLTLCNVYFGGYSTDALVKFAEAARALVAGQLRSMNQHFSKGQRSWRWYYLEVLNQKSLGFFLAPVYLWSAQPRSERLDGLISAFRVINGAYQHWQLLDDVSDRKEDTESGILGAPAYILLAQAELSRKLCDTLGIAVHNGQDVIHEIDTTLLLVDNFRYSELNDPLFHCPAEEKMHSREERQLLCALANNKSDLDVAVPVLMELRMHQAARYLNAMAADDYGAAIAVLDECGVYERILLAAREDATRTRASGILSAVYEPSLVRVVCILDMLMAHAYSKVAKLASGRFDT